MRLFTFILLLNLIAAPSYAQQQKAAPQTQADVLPAADFVTEQIMPLEIPKNISFAQPFILSYRLPADIKIKETKLKDFEILGIAPNPQYADAVDIKMMPFNLKKTQVPAINIVLPDGAEISTTPFDIEIGPANIKLKAKGLIDIRSPYRPFNWWALAGILLGVAIIFGLVRYFLYRRSNKKMAHQNPYANDTRPLHIIALERLNNLLIQDYWQNGDYKGFYTDMMDIFRDYLTARFKFDAHKYTSREMLKQLKKLQDFKADTRLVERLQKTADLVKFAKLTPDTVQRDSDVNDLKDIIISAKEDDTFVAVPTAQTGAQTQDIIDIKHKAQQTKEGGNLP